MSTIEIDGEDLLRLYSGWNSSTRHNLRRMDDKDRERMKPYYKEFEDKIETLLKNGGVEI